LYDSGSDCSPFFYTTNTTIKVHDVHFVGTIGTSYNHDNLPRACNDALILGGTGAGTTGGSGGWPGLGPPWKADLNWGFSGYGSSIKDNYFDNIRKMVFFQAYVNGVEVVNNTAAWSCGSGIQYGAALNVNPNGLALACSGNYFAANLIEATHYQYAGILGGTNNLYIGNQSWDADGTANFPNIQAWNITGTNNMVIGAYSNGANANYLDAYGTFDPSNFVLDSSANVNAYFAGGNLVLGALKLINSFNFTLPGPTLGIVEATSTGGQAAALSFRTHQTSTGPQNNGSDWRVGAGANADFQVAESKEGEYPFEIKASPSMHFADNVWWSSHTPGVSSCGTSPSLQAGSMDSVGNINVGSGGTTTCAVAFAHAFTNTPSVLVSGPVGTSVTSLSKSGFTVTFASSITGGVLSYWAFGLNE
jgi:hypothetical protein